MASATDSPAAVGIEWDLSALFSSPQDPRIAETYERALAEADAFASRYRGRIESGQASPEELAGAIRELETLVMAANKPVTYANLIFSADASNPENGAFLQEQMEQSSAIRVKLMFFELELQAAGQEHIDLALESPALAPYRHYVETVRVYSPHRLSEEQEVLLEETSNTGSRAWVRLHDELFANHPFTFTHPESGESETLTQQEVMVRLRDENRLVRQAAADSLSAGIGQVERVVVFIYNTLLADKKLEDRLRSFGYPEQTRHMANELDKETVDLVTGLCRDRSDLVARYYRVKKEILGLEELTHIDRYAPLFSAKETKTWEEARTLVVESFSQFSPEMAARAEEFFAKNWIDAAPRTGKTGGAFCSYNTPDTHPVVMMSYLGTMDNVMTLAHELGHGVHASLSREQSYFNYQGTLPLAELASIFGEMIVFEEIVAGATVQDRVALYGEKIEGIFASVHRQAAMFRFEQRCHAKRRQDGELSADDFRTIWQEELQSMFQDAVKLGDQHASWWTYVGHFFFAPFYVYAYSFGELLTLSLYQRAKEEGPSFAEKYLQVLRLGGSLNPHQLMAIVGVDLRDRAFWEGGFRAIEAMVGTFEESWASLQRA